MKKQPAEELVERIECQFVGGCRELASFEATPFSQTHDFDSVQTCVKHLGKVLMYEDAEPIQHWKVEIIA